MEGGAGKAMCNRLAWLAVVLLLCATARAGRAQGGAAPRWARFGPENSGLANAQITNVIEALDGTMWFVQPEGISRFDGWAWQSFPMDISLPDDAGKEVTEPLSPPWEAFGLVPTRIHRAIEDSRGAVWLATDAGAFRRARDAWENGIPAYRGMANYQVRDVLRDSYGVLWFAGYDPISGEGSLTGLDPAGHWLFFNAEVEGLVSNQITALAEDAVGGLWAGSVASGVSRYLGNAWQSWTGADSSLSDDRVIGLQAIDDGRVMVVVTRGGVARYDIDADAWEVWFVPPDDGEVSAAFVAADGTLWYGVESAEEHRLGGVSLAGVEVPGILTLAPVNRIAQRGKDGGLWAVAGDSLLCKASVDRGWAEVELLFSEARHVAVDPGGMLWINTSEDLVRYDPDTGAQVVFNSENSGLDGERAHLAHIEDDGLLVFGTDRVYVNSYRPDPPAQPMLTLYVDGVSPVPVLSSEAIRLPAGVGRVAFEISTAAWQPADALVYHTRLEGAGSFLRGLSSDEGVAAHRARMMYTDLGAGEYIFCVYVSDAILDTSEETCARFAVS
jgi:hypothetical protein